MSRLIAAIISFALVGCQPEPTTEQRIADVVQHCRDNHLRVAYLTLEGHLYMVQCVENSSQ